jgi:hypothetical protein
MMLNTTPTHSGLFGEMLFTIRPLRGPKNAAMGRPLFNRPKTSLPNKLCQLAA